MGKKHKILEKLDNYLNNATPEQLAADWEELKQYNQDGPEMLDCLPKTEHSMGVIDWKCDPISSPDTYRFQLDMYKEIMEQTKQEENGEHKHC